MQLKKNGRNGQPKRQIAGFSLIEVLVSLVILSIGLLGSSQLLFAAMKSNDSVAMRSQATVIAGGMLDSIRANPAAALAGSYSASSVAAYAGASACANGSSCSASDMAAKDLQSWKSVLTAATQSGLPGADAQITTTAAGVYTTVTVSVSWDDSRAAGAFSSVGCTVVSGGSSCQSRISLQTVL